MHVWASILMGMFCVLAGPVLALMSSPPVSGQPVLVITAPWGSTAEELIALAGGVPVGPVSAPIAIMATSDEVAFVMRLKQAGAWLVLDGQRLAAICGDPI